MTLEELAATPMKYTFGYSAEDHGLRQYQSEDGLIAKQVYTPRNPKTLVWGDDKTTFMLTDTKEEFETAQELLDAINRRGCPPCNTNCNQGRDCPARNDHKR